MPQQIGLEAVMYTQQFQNGMQTYMTGLATMTGATQSFASDLGAGFGQYFIFDSLAHAIRNTVGAAVDFVKEATLAAIDLVVEYASTAVEKAADLEAQISNITAVLGGSREDLASLRDLITQIDLDPKLVVTAEEAAKAMEYLAKGGATTAEIMGGLARQTLLLAQATGGDFDTAANAVLNTMRVFNLSMEDTGKVIDTVVGYVNKSRFSLNDWQYVLGTAGAVAATLGIDIDDLATALVQTAGGFNSSRDQGTSYKVFLTNLIPYTDKAAVAMKEFGFVTDDGTNRLIEQIKAGSGLEGVARLLQSALGGLSEEQQILATRTMFGVDGYRAALQLIRLNLDEYPKFREEITRLGQAEEMAAIRTDNFAAKMEKLGSVLNQIQLQLGEQLTKKLLQPIAEGLFDTFASNFEKIGQVWQELGAVFDRYAEPISASLNRIVEAFLDEAPKITPIVDNLLAVFTRLLDKLAPLVETYLPDFVDGLVDLSQWLREAVETGDAFNDTLEGMSGPFRVVADLLAEFSRLLEPVGRFLDEIQAATEAWGAGLPAAIGAAFSPIATFVGLIEKALQGLTGLTQVIGGLGKLLQGDLAEGFRRIAAGLWDMSLFSFIAGQLQAWGINIVSVFQNIWTQITSGAQAAWSSISSLLTGAWSAITQGAQAAWNGFGSFFAGLWAGIGTGAQAAWQAIGASLQQAWQAITQGAQAAWDGLAQFFVGLWQGITTAAQGAWQGLTASLQTLWQGAVSAGQTTWNTLVTALAGIWQTIAGAAQSAWQDISSSLQTLWTQITTAGQETWDSFAQALQETWDTLIEAGRAAWEGFQETLQGIWNSIKEAASTAWNAIKAAIESVVNSIKAVWDSLKAKGEEVFNGIRQAAASAFDPGFWFDLGKNAVQGLINGIGSLIDQARAKIQELLNLQKEAASAETETSSPSRWYMRLGQNVVKGYLMGIDREMAKVTGSLGTDFLFGGSLPSRLYAAAGAGPTMQTYHQSSTVTNNMGPFVVNSPMDLAELEVRVRRWVAEAM